MASGSSAAPDPTCPRPPSLPGTSRPSPSPRPRFPTFSASGWRWPPPTSNAAPPTSQRPVYRFGHRATDADGTIVDIEEKPERPASNLAIAGIYKFSVDAKRYFADLPL